MFTSADFEKAKARFQELFKQISNTIIRIEGEKPFILNGQFESPTGEIKTTIIRFHFLPASGIVQHLKVELSMQFVSEWVIKLTVYDQDNLLAATNQ